MTWDARHSRHSSLNGLWATLRRTFVRPQLPTGRSAPADGLDLMERACAELRNGHLRAVEELLDGAGPRARTDAARLNLLGVVHEMRRHWRAAKRCYGQAMRTDPHFQPAQQNMRRMYELETFGRSAIPMITGHLLTDVCLARPGDRGIVS